MDSQLLQALEKKIDDLVDQCNTLRQENQTLKSQETAWREERDKLNEKNELARSRVDSMISRLRTLGQDS